MKYTQEQFEAICAPYIADLNIDLSLGPKDSYDIRSLARHCANRVTIDLDWGILGSRLALIPIRNTAGKTFSESTNLLKIYLDPDYYNFVQANKEILDTIPDESKSDNKQAICIGVLEKTYLLKYNKCGNCKQDCPECEKFYIGETPEQLYMRIATFLCYPNIPMITKAYNYISDQLYSHATPTMYNAGLLRPQMASCFVLTVEDSLWSIEDHWMYVGEISRNSGGIGLDVSKIRHSFIGNAGKSDGVPAMLKPFERILEYVDQSKKRKGSAAAYLSVWHVDILEFINLKVPIGDNDQDPTPNLFFGVWVPDLFMKRLKEDGNWTLFCPKRCPGLTETWGDDFEELYIKYEKERRGIKTIKAAELAEHLYNAHCKVGVPYICFSDRFNESNMQDGIIRSSNLCAEIALHTSDKEIATCNLASICLGNFVKDKSFNFLLFEEVVRFVVRIMNNVIDRNYYPERIPQIKYANFKNRPLGIGIQGLANTFARLEILYDSDEARSLNNKISQALYYYAVDESANIASEKGPYPAFSTSPYARSLLHPDLWQAPNGDKAKFLSDFDWDGLRRKVSKGMYNSTLISLMPTATSSIIAEQAPCFEQFNFVVGTKTLISGQYTVVCPEFARDMKQLGVWSPELCSQICIDEDNDIGSCQHLVMPESIRGKVLKESRWKFILDKYRTSFEIGPKTSIIHASDRTPFVCQSQSLNWFVADPNRKKFERNLFEAWSRGNKTGCYYSRSKAGVKTRGVTTCTTCST